MRGSAGTEILRRAIVVALAGCLAAIVAGPWYTDPGYDWMSRSVSELAGQNTQHAWVMRAGLIAFGLASATAAVARRPPVNFFFVAFGVSIALSGLFPHKPFVAGRPYSETLDQLHSVLASLGGLCAVAGFVMQARFAASRRAQLVYGTIAVAYTLLPLLMFLIPALQGLFQRALFLSYAAWVICDGLPARGAAGPTQASG